MLPQEYPSNVLLAIYRVIGDSVATIKFQMNRDPASAMKTLARGKKNILAGSCFTAEVKAVQCGKIDEVCAFRLQITKECYTDCKFSPLR